MSENDYDLDIQSIGVPSWKGETWQDAVNRRRRERRSSFDCALCGEWHDSRGAATRCCSERFD